MQFPLLVPFIANFALLYAIPADLSTSPPGKSMREIEKSGADIPEHNSESGKRRGDRPWFNRYRFNSQLPGIGCLFGGYQTPAHQFFCPYVLRAANSSEKPGRTPKCAARFPCFKQSISARQIKPRESPQRAPQLPQQALRRELPQQAQRPLQRELPQWQAPRQQALR